MTQRESTEELASRTTAGFLRVHQDWCNHVDAGLNPAEYLQTALHGLTPAQAALVGFRLAQGLRETRSGDMQAPAVHALNRLRVPEEGLDARSLVLSFSQRRTLDGFLAAHASELRHYDPSEVAVGADLRAISRLRERIVTIS